MTSGARRHVLGGDVERFVRLGLRDDLLLLAIGMTMEVQEHPGEAKWFGAARRVHRGHPRRIRINGQEDENGDVRYWLETTLRNDLPRHVPAHEQPDGPVLTCVAPMIRRDFCGRDVHLRPWSSGRGLAIPVLVDGHVAWHAYCDKHSHVPHDLRPDWKVQRKGAPEAYAAAKRLRHNTGGQLRDAFPMYRMEEGYRWADKRWEPDDRPVEPVRLRLVPPLEPASDTDA